MATNCARRLVSTQPYLFFPRPASRTHFRTLLSLNRIIMGLGFAFICFCSLLTETLAGTFVPSLPPLFSGQWLSFPNLPSTPPSPPYPPFPPRPPPSPPPSSCKRLAPTLPFGPGPVATYLQDSYKVSSSYFNVLQTPSINQIFLIYHKRCYSTATSPNAVNFLVYCAGGSNTTWLSYNNQNVAGGGTPGRIVRGNLNNLTVYDNAGQYYEGLLPGPLLGCNLLTLQYVSPTKCAIALGTTLKGTTSRTWESLANLPLADQILGNIGVSNRTDGSLGFVPGCLY